MVMERIFLEVDSNIYILHFNEGESTTNIAYYPLL